MLGDPVFLILFAIGFIGAVLTLYEVILKPVFMYIVKPISLWQRVKDTVIVFILLAGSAIGVSAGLISLSTIFN